MSDINFDPSSIPEVGNIVVVHFNFNDEDGNTVEKKDFFGRITKMTDEEVVLKNPNNGEEVTLPSQFGSYVKPPQGSYPLPTTGETVENPDYITEWTLRIASAS